MAWSEITGNTTTLTGGGTEDSIIAAQTTAGMYVVAVDLNAIVNGDVGEIRVYTKVRTGATARIIYRFSFAHIQSNPNWQSPILVVGSGDIAVKIVQSAGTGRAVITSLMGDPGGGGASVADIADGVWDEALAGHVAAGSAGERAGRIPNVAAGGNGGIVLADAGGRAKVDVERWQTGTPSALQSGRVDSHIGSVAAGVIAAASFAANALDAVWATATRTLTSGAPTAAENAEALLKADWSTITGEASRSLLNAGRFLRNKWTLVGGVLSVKKEDDSTEAWSATVTTAESDPVSGIDPA